METNGLIIFLLFWIFYFLSKIVSKQLILGRMEIILYDKFRWIYFSLFSQQASACCFSKTLCTDIFHTYLFGHESCNNWIKDACRVTKWNYARKCRSKIPSSLSRVGESINGNGGVSNKLSDIHRKVANTKLSVPMISIVL